MHQDFSNTNVKVPIVSNKVSYIDASDASESYSVSLEDQKSDKIHVQLSLRSSIFQSPKSSI